MSSQSTPEFQLRDIFKDGATTLRFASVLGLQMGQILPNAFVALMLPVIFREQGLALDMYWVFTLPLIPTWLRPLWAPYVDRTGSRTFGMRRSWFIPCTTFGAIAYLVMGMWAPTLENLQIIITLWVIKSTVMTTQDIAIDGYMVENIYDHERPVGAAVLDIGRNLSRFVSWVVIAWIFDRYGWTTAMTVAAGLLIVFSTPGILRREPPRPAQFTQAHPSLKNLLKRRESRYVYPLCFFIALFGGMTAALFPTYLSDMGFRAAEVATLVGPATLVGTLIGATVASLCLRRFGYRSTFLIAAVAMVGAVVPIVWLGTVDDPTYLIVMAVAINGIALPSLLDVSFQAARLKWASRSQAATDYTTQIVTFAAGYGAATAVGGLLAHHVGWFAYFAIAGALTCTMCFVLWGLYQTIEDIVDERDTRELAAVEAARAAGAAETGG